MDKCLSPEGDHLQFANSTCNGRANFTQRILCSVLQGSYASFHVAPSEQTTRLCRIYVILAVVDLPLLQVWAADLY